jgi:hypothetical protein
MKAGWGKASETVPKFITKADLNPVKVGPKLRALRFQEAILRWFLPRGSPSHAGTKNLDKGCDESIARAQPCTG